MNSAQYKFVTFIWVRRFLVTVNASPWNPQQPNVRELDLHTKSASQMNQSTFLCRLTACKSLDYLGNIFGILR